MPKSVRSGEVAINSNGLHISTSAQKNLSDWN